MSSTADWVTAGANLALVLVAAVGFAATVFTIIRGRNRQRIEIEGYVRVDVGPPQGTDDFTPPTEIARIERSHLTTVGDAGEEAPAISVWYRNLQSHPLGVALGVVSRIIAEVTDLEGEVYQVSQTHEIAYIEPGKCVRIDVVRFPPSWEAMSRFEAIEYRNLDWDGATPRHGRRECYYEDGEFYMVPWSDPINSLRDRIDRQLERLSTKAREIWAGLRRGPSA